MLRCGRCPLLLCSPGRGCPPCSDVYPRGRSACSSEGGPAGPSAVTQPHTHQPSAGRSTGQAGWDQHRADVRSIRKGAGAVCDQTAIRRCAADDKTGTGEVRTRRRGRAAICAQMRTQQHACSLLLVPRQTSPHGPMIQRGLIAARRAATRSAQRACRPTFADEATFQVCSRTILVAAPSAAAASPWSGTLHRSFSSCAAASSAGPRTPSAPSAPPFTVTIPGTRTILLPHALPLSLAQPNHSDASGSSAAASRNELAGPLALTYFDSAWTDLDGEVASRSKPVILVMPSMSHSALVCRPEGSSSGDELRGWWDDVVGRGSSFGIDLSIFRVVCASPLGGPYGSVSPLSLDPSRGGLPYRAHFPLVTPLDQARLAAAMLDHLGVGRVHGVVGASMGGMGVLHFAREFPQRYERFAVICSTARTSPSTQALRSVQRAAVRADPDFSGGEYADLTPPHNQGPLRGMAIARMFGTICYRSREEFDQRFSSKPRIGGTIGAGTDGDDACSSSAAVPPSHLLEVESYLSHAASTFTGRYDANCYLTLSQAMDLMDIAQDIETPATHPTHPHHAAAVTHTNATHHAAPAHSAAPHVTNHVHGATATGIHAKTRHLHGRSYEQACSEIPRSKQALLLPIASDALIPPAELDHFGAVLGSQGKRVHLERIHSLFGHDAFLKREDCQRTFNPRLSHFFDPREEDGVQKVRAYVNSTLDL